MPRFRSGQAGGAAGGGGTVKTVAGKSPDAQGAVALLPADVGAADAAAIAAAVAALVNSAPGTLDTLGELAAALAADESTAAALATAVGNRLRYDAAQSLSGPQQTQVLTNAGLTAAGRAMAQAANAAAQATLLGLGTPAEVLIQAQVLASAAASVTFSSIPQTYRDLRLVVRGRGDTTGNNYCRPRVQMNGDTGNNYDFQRGQSTGSSVAPYNGGAVAFIDIGLLPSATGPANYAGGADVRLLDYRGTTFYKQVLLLSGGPAVGNIYAEFGTGWWRSTAAITSLTLLLDAGNLAAGSVVSLYGIL